MDSIPRTLMELMIEPIGWCNLKCVNCPTPKTNAMLSKGQIISFVERYLDYMEGKGSVNLFWIGRGEVSLHKDLGSLVNYFNQKYRNRVTHYIQTNGIDIQQLRRILYLGNVTISVSLDGFANDLNRGPGTFEIIVHNIEVLKSLGFKINIHAIVMPENIDSMPAFIEYMRRISPAISNTFAPLFAPQREEELKQMRAKMERTPEIVRGLGMDDATKPDDKTYLSLSCEGGVYNCCELIYQVGNIDEDIPSLVQRFLGPDLCPSCQFFPYCSRKYNKEGL